MLVHQKNDASIDGFAKQILVMGNGEWETSDQ